MVTDSACKVSTHAAHRPLLLFTGFLELINNMLTSGMVPALYPDDEKEAIIGQVSNGTIQYLSMASVDKKNPISYYNA